MGFESSQWVWFNGKCVPWQDATVHVSAHALHYGSGVFEGIRCYQTSAGPALFRVDAHIERLYASAATYRMKIPYSKEELIEAIRETVWRNGFTDCYVRPVCCRGSASLSVHPRNCPVEVVILDLILTEILLRVGTGREKYYRRGSEKAKSFHPRAPC